MAGKNEARLGMDISDYEKKLAKATNDLNKFVKGGVGSLGSLSNAFGTLTGRSGGSTGALIGSLGSLAATLGATASAASIMKSSIDTAMNFEKSMSSLKSLTGLGGEAMEDLKAAAIDLGASTTQSASQVADAFRLIGSSKPELLGSTTALRSVTEAAITLAEASGMEVPDAAKALTTSLNQLGAGADQAARFINVLAAGSQKGAGDINWLNGAITQSGTAAKAVGVEYEELVANLEQLAQGGFEAGSAGTALRSIIMSLEKQSNGKLKPSVVGLTSAFANLGKECKTIGDYQAIAGKEFASQAKILADNADKAEKMRAAISGTSTATEQAKINNDNFAGSVKNLSSAWEGLMLTINDSNGMLKGWVDNTTKLVNNLRYLMSSHDTQVSMGANRLLNGTDNNGLLATLSARMDATVANSWSKEDATRMALKDLDKWFYAQRAAHRKSKKELEMVTEAYERAQQYVKNYFKELEQGQARVDATGGAGGNTVVSPKGGKDAYMEGTLGYYEQKLKAANDALNQAASAEAYSAAKQIVAIYEREISKIKNGGISTSGTSVNTNIPSITGIDKAAASFDTKGLSEFGSSAKECADLLDRIADFKSDTMTEGIYQLSDAFQTLGNTVGGAAGNVLSLAGAMAQQVVSGMTTIATLKAEQASHMANIAALRAEALARHDHATVTALDAAAGALAAHSSIPFVGVAMGVGMVASLISTLSSMPKFAEGAYVNRPTVGLFGEAGPEFVLPEKKLDEAFQRNGSAGNIQVEGNITVKGEDINIALARYGQRTGKGKIVYEKSVR